MRRPDRYILRHTATIMLAFMVILTALMAWLYACPDPVPALQALGISLVTLVFAVAAGGYLAWR